MSDIKTNITINVVEPGSSTPVVPNTSTIESISTPDTGLFTSGIGAKEATIIGIVAFIVLVAIASAIIHYHNKKHGKITKLTRLLAKYRNTVRSKKKLSIPLASLALVVSLGTFASLVKTGVNAEEANNTEAQDNTSLTIGISSPDLTIEVADEPVFAILPVELTVEEATRAGYTLTAYADSTDIVSTTNPNNIIPMVTVDSEEDLVSLTNNTYGISLSEPTSRGDKVYTTLSANQNTPTILKTIDDYSPTEAEDKTTIYYGFYITPDVPKGTYESSSIYYEAEPNYITTLSFNGNDNDGGEDMEDITIPAGNTITLPGNTYTKDGYHFTGWNTQADGEGEPYVAGAEFTATQGETKDITLYAQWEEDILYMQDVATWKDTLTTDETITAIDNRDGKEYTVAKLQDGKVWMTRNLDLQKEDLKAGVTLDSTNTDHPASGFVLPDSQKSGNDSWYDSSNEEASINTAHVYDLNDNGETYYYCLKNNAWGGCDAYSEEIIPSEDLGNYYNWYSATAGTGTYSLGDGDVATGSICPAGWRLPNNSTDGSATDYSTLLHAYGVINSATSPYTTDSEKLPSIYGSPLSLTRAGEYGSGVYAVGGYNFLSSSVAKRADEIYIFSSEVVGVRPWNYRSKYYGYSVRCVAE